MSTLQIENLHSEVIKAYTLTTLKDDFKREDLEKKKLDLRNDFKLVWNDKKGIYYDKVNEVQTIFNNSNELIGMLLSRGYDLHQDVYDTWSISNDFNMFSISEVLRIYGQDVKLSMDTWVEPKNKTTYPLKFKVYYCKNDKRLVLNIHDVKEDILISCRTIKNIISVLIDIGSFDSSTLWLQVRQHKFNEIA